MTTKVFLIAVYWLLWIEISLHVNLKSEISRFQCNCARIYLITDRNLANIVFLIHLLMLCVIVCL